MIPVYLLATIITLFFFGLAFDQSVFKGFCCCTIILVLLGVVFSVLTIKYRDEFLKPKGKLYLVASKLFDIKIFKLLLIGFICLNILLIGASIAVSNYNWKYNKSIKAQEAKEINYQNAVNAISIDKDKAIKLLEQLTNYKDSNQLLDQARFDYAVELINKKENYKAAQFLIEISPNSVVSDESIETLLKICPDLLKQSCSEASKGNYDEAKRIIAHIPQCSNNYKEAQSKINEWENKLNEAKSSELYDLAYKSAVNKDYIAAIKTMEQIQQNSANYNKAQSKIKEWNHLLNEKQSAEFFNKAYKLAVKGDYNKAIVIMAQIKQGTNKYTQGQQKIKEWNKLYNQQQNEKVITTTAHQGPGSYTEEGYICALLKSDFDRASSYIAVKDTSAVNQLIIQKRVFWLKPNVKVHILEYESGVVQIRPQGQTGTCWTYSEAIKERH